MTFLSKNQFIALEYILSCFVLLYAPCKVEFTDDSKILSTNVHFRKVLLSNFIQKFRTCCFILIPLRLLWSPKEQAFQIFLAVRFLFLFFFLVWGCFLGFVFGFFFDNSSTLFACFGFVLPSG